MRSIPACAGEPHGGGAAGAGGGVYPRVCGGTALVAAAALFSMGLSPRVRGNLDFHADGAAVEGSIPACAGEPFQQVFGPGSYSVYPRVCGGTSSASSVASRRQGLSPRVRGNHPERSTKLLSIRSIPACAGKPLGYDVKRDVPGVYPRVCGGTLSAMRPARTMTGLSPRVRGNPVCRRHRPGEYGSIPACAGEPPGCGCPGPQRGVYPRVCGGTQPAPHHIQLVRGLSPRVRGNPCLSYP